jgi:hypothetical protein
MPMAKWIQMEEIKKDVLKCVCLATDFCQQVVVEPGCYGLSKAFHEVWVRLFLWIPTTETSVGIASNIWCTTISNCF